MPPKRGRDNEENNNDERVNEIEERKRVVVAHKLVKTNSKSQLGSLLKSLKKMELNSKKGGFRKSKNKKNKKIKKTKKTKKNKKKY